MHPDLVGALGSSREQELRQSAARHLVVASADTTEDRSGGEIAVSIRTATDADGPALVSLAALDGALPACGPALVAEVGGSLAAVLPLDGGRPYADPFRRTAEIVALLELRARQIARQPRVTRAWPSWLTPAAVRRRLA